MNDHKVNIRRSYESVTEPQKLSQVYLNKNNAQQGSDAEAEAFVRMILLCCDRLNLTGECVEEMIDFLNAWLEMPEGTILYEDLLSGKDYKNINNNCQNMAEIQNYLK